MSVGSLSNYYGNNNNINADTTNTASLINNNSQNLSLIVNN